MRIRMVVTAGLGIVMVGLLVFLMRPMCMPLGPENLASFHIPARERMEQRDLYLKIWQEKGGRWYQCKTYLTRLLT